MVALGALDSQPGEVSTSASTRLDSAVRVELPSCSTARVEYSEEALSK